MAFEKMLQGDPNYFVCDIDCSFSLHPMMNGKPMRPLITQDEVDNAFATNPYKAEREYNNRFDRDGGEDVFVKRSTILKNSYSYYPVYANDGEKKYAIFWDPASKLDNSFVLIAEIIHDEVRGWMAKIVNGVNLIETLPNGDKMVIQKPEQIEIVKQMLLDYNRGAIDYDNILTIQFDAGAGGGGFDAAAVLLNTWTDKQGKSHYGIIDENDPYMKLRLDDYPEAIKKLVLFNFKRDKVQAYERTQQAINQGLIMFPKSLNARNEMEFEEQAADGTTQLRYEKAGYEDMISLAQIDLLKEEVVAMQKTKRPNGTIVFELSPDAKQRNFHDDRVDCCAMLGNFIMELRAQEALTLEEKPVTAFTDLLAQRRRSGTVSKASQNPFANKGGANPFTKYSKR